MRKTQLTATAVLALVASGAAGQTPQGLGEAGRFGVFAFVQDHSAGSELIINSMHSFTGDLGVGAGVGGPRNQKVDQFGSVYLHGSATSTFFEDNYIATGGVHTSAGWDATLDQAAADALAASAAYAANPGVNLGDLTADTTVAANDSGPYYTIDSLSFNSNTLTLQGDADDYFVFNVTGDFSFFQSQIILDGVDASRVLFNFPTTGSEIDFSKSGNVVNGTVLAPFRDVHYHNPATFNGAIIGGRGVNLHSDAILTQVPFAGAPTAPLETPDLSCSIFVLNETAGPALNLSGSAWLVAGDVNVRSNATKAVNASGGASMRVASLNVAGATNFSGSSMCDGDVLEAASIESDPFAGMAWDFALPLVDLGSRSISSDETAVVTPGYYSGGINITSADDVIFLPGVYHLGGNGLRISSTVSIMGEGVVFVFHGGSLSMSGDSGISISAPTSGAFEGLAIVQPATNTERLSLSGGSNMRIDGGIYAPAAEMTLSGSSSAGSPAPLAGTFIVADTLEVSGSGEIQVGTCTATEFRSLRMPSPNALWD